MGMKNMQCVATIFAVLMASASVSAQEITFNSIRQGESTTNSGEWIGRDVWAPDRITNVANPGYPGTFSVYRFIVEPGDKGGPSVRATGRGVALGQPSLLGT